MKTDTIYNCPLCNAELKTSLGNVFHPGDVAYGLTLYCDNTNCRIEVFGHTNGTKRLDAYGTIMDKYARQTNAAK